MHIAELTYTEMIGNGIGPGASTIQNSGFLDKTTC